jgi:hypothetical protein
MIANILNEIAKAALSYLNKFLDKTEPELDCRFDSQKLVYIWKNLSSATKPGNEETTV